MAGATVGRTTNLEVLSHGQTFGGGCEPAPFEKFVIGYRGCGCATLCSSTEKEFSGVDLTACGVSPKSFRNEVTQL